MRPPRDVLRRTVVLACCAALVRCEYDMPTSEYRAEDVAASEGGRPNATVLFQEAESLRMGLESGASDVAGAIRLYREAAALGGPGAGDALCALAILHEEGVPGVLERDLPTAMALYNQSAAAGNATARFTVGVLSSYGLFGFPQDDVTSSMQYYFAAMGGLATANVALGYRWSSGVVAPKKCSAAVQYYQSAAAKAAQILINNGGTIPVVERIRLSDDTLDSLGERAADQENLAVYYKNLVEMGNSDATALAQIAHWYYYGARGVKQDFATAAELFQIAEEHGVQVSGSLGHMYLHGLGVPVDHVRAREYFEEGTAAAEPSAQNGLGYMLVYGLGGQPDIPRGVALIQQASSAGNVDATVNLGMLKLEGIGFPAKDLRGAAQNFAAASNMGHLLASHALGNMVMLGLGVEKSCTRALALFQAVCAQGPWNELFARAEQKLSEGDAAAALIDFLRLAELGYPEAQVSAAYLLDEVLIPEVRSVDADTSTAPLFSRKQSGQEEGEGEKEGERKEERKGEGEAAEEEEAVRPGAGGVPLSSVQEAEARALMLYRLASTVDSSAMLRLGDMHYYGAAGLPVSPLKAAELYRRSSRSGHLSQAMYNLGYMYEFGVGVDRDLNLAKRNYDDALANSPNSYYVVQLCLLRVKLTAWWESVPLAAENKGPKMPLGEWMESSLVGLVSPLSRRLGVPSDTLFLSLAVSLLLSLLYLISVRRASARAMHYRRLIVEERRRAAAAAAAGPGA